jgi:signal transduction histidine kinase
VGRPSKNKPVFTETDWLIGKSETADLIRSLDWTKSPLGPNDQWPVEMRTLVNALLSSPIPLVLLWGPDLRLIYNDAYLVIIGDRHPAAFGDSLKNVWPEAWGSNKPTFDRVLQRGESFFLEDQLFQLRRKNSEPEDLWFTVSYSPIYLQTGRIGGVQVVLMETTQRIKAETELKRALTTLAEAQKVARLGTFEYLADTKTTIWSDEEFRIYGLDPSGPSPAYEVLLEKHIHPDDSSLLIKVFSKALETQSIYELEHRIVRPNGETRWVYDRAHPYLDPNGKLIRYIGITLDITLQKTLEADLRAAIALRDEFISIASHELKTPLTALFLQLQILNRMIAAEKAPIGLKIKQISEKSLVSTKALSILLEDLLDVTRIRVGRINLNLEKMDLKEIIQETIASIQEAATMKGCRIEFHSEKTVIGHWDRIRATQIVSNLLSNAMKYGDSRPIEVTLSVDSGTARIEVRDHGIGIPKEMQFKIFERFQRAVRSDQFTGLGLGLYVCKQLTEAHGGKIYVESEPGQGALFVVELPLVPDSSKDTE